MPRTRPRAAVERFARAMGTDVHVIVVGGPPRLADAAVARIGDLERRWTRFAPSSELAWLNAMAGEHVLVSAETRLLVTCSVLGWQRSGGLFDPTVHDALVAAGYDRDFALLPADIVPAPASPVPGCGGIAVDETAHTVRLPEGVHLDPGGIGKGLAADLVVEQLLDDGAAGACVNLGGDLRVVGESPGGSGWRVAVPWPVAEGGDARVWGQLTLQEGAVATSSTQRRRWQAGGRLQHHLIDPATGRPARSHVVAATVVAPTAWEAEVAAKAAVIGDAADAQCVALLLASGLVLFDAAGAASAMGDLPLVRDVRHATEG